MSLTNTNIWHYRILSKLGMGGMGEVYLAQDTKLDRKVALKILTADFAANQEYLRRFVQEAKAVSALNHPNIMTIHEIDEPRSGHFVGTEFIPSYGPTCVVRRPESIRFITTEFIDGETLRVRMKRERLTIRQSLDAAIQIASALSAAHKAGIIHRDIKPRNIMIGHDGQVKVLDFGIARVTRHGRLETVGTEAATKPLIKTEPGAVVGTAHYMSPEQARGLDVDGRTDIWSLGCVLYEMITGRRPFGGDTSLDVLSAVINREPDLLDCGIPEAPEALVHVVGKALRKDRAERYQTAEDLIIDLNILKDELGAVDPNVHTI